MKRKTRAVEKVRRQERSGMGVEGEDYEFFEHYADDSPEWADIDFDEFDWDEVEDDVGDEDEDDYEPDSA